MGCAFSLPTTGKGWQWAQPYRMLRVDASPAEVQCHLIPCRCVVQIGPDLLLGGIRKLAPSPRENLKVFQPHLRWVRDPLLQARAVGIGAGVVGCGVGGFLFFFCFESVT